MNGKWIILKILILVFSFFIMGRSGVFAAEDDLVLKAERLLERIKTLQKQDISYVIGRTEEAITDEVSQENLERVYQTLEYYYYLLNKEKVRELSARMEKLAEQMNQPSFIRMAKAYQSFSYSLDGEYTRAISELKQQLNMARENHDNLTVVTIYEILAGLEAYQEQFFVSLQYVEQARLLLKDAPYQNQLRVHLYYTLAYIHTELNDLDKAMEYINSSFDIIEKTGLYTDISSLEYNLAMALHHHKYFEISRRIFEDIISFNEISGQVEQNIYPLYGLAISYNKQDNMEKSLEYVERALQYDYVSEDFSASILMLGAEQLAKLGQLKKALEYRGRVEIFFNKYPEYKSIAWDNFLIKIDAEIAMAENRYQDASRLLEEFYRKDITEMEKTFSTDMIKLRAELEATTRIGKAQQAMLLEKKELKLQYFTYLTGIFVILILVILVAFIQQRRNVAALNKSRIEAEMASRVKTEFLANMSHELRTPLNAIIGFSEMISDKVFGPVGHQNYEQYAQMINSSGHHLLKIINDILDMSKVESGTLELNEQDCDLIEVIQSAINVVSAKSGDEKLNIDFKPPKDFPDLLADVRILNQILYNGLSNAVKFNKPGGKIGVSLKYFPDSGTIKIRISDSGIGMSKEEVKQVMKPFAQGQNSLTRDHQGTGLGLPLMEAFMKLHGGSIDIKSTKHVGTTLILNFPAERTIPFAA